MKGKISIFFAALILSASAAAQPQLQGPQSGALGPGTYLVVGDISVADGDSLAIAPGTVFLHNGYWYWRIYGTLLAVGTATDSIKWLRQQAIPEHRWAGIRFQSGAPSGSMISYAVIEYGYVPVNGPSSDLGGCLYSNGVSLTISHSRIAFGNAWWGGGGICASSVNGLDIHDCLIADNQDNEWMGGGIYLSGCTNVTISHNVIIRNASTGDEDICGGGGIRCNGGTAINLSYNEIYDNTANHHGAGLMVQNSNPVLINNTITQNRCLDLFPSGSGGGLMVYMNTSGSFSGINNIIYGNIATVNPEYQGAVDLNYCCCSQTLSGTGNITGSPMFVSPNSNDFHLQAGSPCIDTGDPASPLDPDSTRADMGALYFDQSTPLGVSITLTPQNPPIQIPASGGSFQFTVSLENNDASPHNFDAWIMVTLPNGSSYGPVLGPLTLTLGGGVSVSRLRSQSVPAGAPPGDYTYIGNVGLYPDTIWNSDSFPFVKLTTGNGSIEPDWANTGDSFGLWQITGEGSLQNEIALSHAFPNPFNATTAIYYQLPADGHVGLQMFDLSGRSVAILVEGWQDAGLHEVRFDGRDLPSGIYLYRIQAGAWSETGKMILLK